jgi:hypothetical protein
MLFYQQRISHNSKQQEEEKAPQKVTEKSEIKPKVNLNEK